MGLFRAARTVTSPTGDYWELYVSKTALPSWRGSDSDDVAISGLPDLPIAIAAAIWANVVLPLGRVVALLPLAIVRGRRSHAVRIEAVKSFPRREVLLWTTTDVHRARVLEEVAAGLAQGKVVCPDGAVYSGAE